LRSTVRQKATICAQEEKIGAAEPDVAEAQIGPLALGIGRAQDSFLDNAGNRIAILLRFVKEIVDHFPREQRMVGGRDEERPRACDFVESSKDASARRIRRFDDLHLAPRHTLRNIGDGQNEFRPLDRDKDTREASAIRQGADDACHHRHAADRNEGLVRHVARRAERIVLSAAAREDQGRRRRTHPGVFP
jgi:hypothetical protein